jgi:hypothetical protein
MISPPPISSVVSIEPSLDISCDGTRRPHSVTGTKSERCRRPVSVQIYGTKLMLGA